MGYRKTHISTRSVPRAALAYQVLLRYGQGRDHYPRLTDIGDSACDVQTSPGQGSRPTIEVDL